MTRALLLLIAMCFGVTYGVNYAMHTVFHDDVFGDASVQEIADAGKVWR